MAKKKHPIYRLHKIKVHPNRWLIWTLAYAVLMTIAVVGYIKISDLEFGEQMAENVFTPWHSYRNISLGYSLMFPPDWSLEAENSNTINFIPNSTNDIGVSLAVVDPSAETSIRKSLKVVAEDRIDLDHVNSALVKSSLDSSHTESVVMSLHNHKLYVIRGTDTLVKKLILTFHFVGI